MLSKAFPGFAIGVLSLGLSFPAFAEATLSHMAGNVLVNRGVGYRPVATNARFQAGDRILINARSSAQLEFPDGCKIRLLPGVVTIPKSSPCKVRSQAQAPGDRRSLAGGFLSPALGFGAVAVLGAGLLAIENNSNRNNRGFASP